MGKTGTVKHTHQYFKHIDGLWHCSGIDNCTHYMPRNMPEPAGKRSLCWQCGEEFQLTPVNMKINKPVCERCEDQIDEVEDYLEKRLREARERANQTDTSESEE